MSRPDDPLDQLFRDGLAGRQPRVRPELWDRIGGARPAAPPEGEGIDALFAAGLADRTPAVPTEVWDRISAAGLANGSTPDVAFARALADRTPPVPAGLWSRVWAARTTARWRKRAAVAGALLLLVGLVAWAIWPAAPGTDPPPGVAQRTTAAAAAATPEETAAESTAGTDRVAPGRAGAEARPSAVSATPAVTTDRTGAAARSSVASPTPATSVNRAPAPGRPVVSTSPTDPALRASAPQEGRSVGGAPSAETVDPAGAAPAVRAVAALPARREMVATPLTGPDPAQTRAARRLLAAARRAGQTVDRHAFRAAPRHRFQPEFLFGAAYANQQLGLNDAGAAALLEAREVSEFPELSYQVALRGAFRLRDRWSLRPGLTYTEIRNQFEYERTVNGAPTLVRVHNQLRQLEAPLLLGYRVPGRRLSVTLHAGPVVNLTTGVRGRFLDPAAAVPQDLSTTGDYRRNTGVGFMTSLTTAYTVGKREPFVLLVEPFFKMYPGSYTRPTAPLRERYWLAGLQLGVRKGI